jgi:hypothetical protein
MMRKILVLSICLAVSFAASAQDDLTFLEADDPVALTAEQKAEWEKVSGKLNAAWGDTDFAYQRSVVPTEVSSEPFRMTVWKGERASALIVLWSGKAKKRVECKIGDF